MNICIPVEADEGLDSLVCAHHGHDHGHHHGHP